MFNPEDLFGKMEESSSSDSMSPETAEALEQFKDVMETMKLMQDLENGTLDPSSPEGMTSMAKLAVKANIQSGRKIRLMPLLAKLINKTLAEESVMDTEQYEKDLKADPSIESFEALEPESFTLTALLVTLEMIAKHAVSRKDEKLLRMVYSLGILNDPDDTKLMEECQKQADIGFQEAVVNDITGQLQKRKNEAQGEDNGQV